MGDEQKEDIPCDTNNEEQNEVENGSGDANDDHSHCSIDESDDNEMTEQAVGDPTTESKEKDADQVSLDKDDNINEPTSDEAQVFNEEELNDGYTCDANSGKSETNEEKQIDSDDDE